MIRDFVANVGERAGLPPGAVAKLELAVDEACSNVIEHAYGRDQTREVSIRATVEDLVAKRSSVGLGMRLMKSLMDEVHYELRMVKRVRK